MPESETAAVRPSPPYPVVAARAAAAALVLETRDVLACSAARDRFRGQVYAMLADNQPLSVTVRQCDGEDGLHDACRLLREAAIAAQAPAKRIEIAVPAAAGLLRQAWLMRTAFLGRGPLHLLAAGGVAEDSDGQRARRWRELWSLRANPHIRLASAPDIGSACILLPGERADVVQPGTGLQVPAGTAWVTAPIDLLDHADRHGRIDRSALGATLSMTVDVADVVHDTTTWPTAAMRDDAWMNRRLAIRIEGLGDLVALRGQDPRQLGCLQSLDELLCWCRAVLYERSRQLARTHGYLPALELDHAFAQAVHGSAMQSWRQHWEHAIDVSAIRHRNLLTLSPWSVFPRTGTAGTASLDLLPLLHAADSFAFPAPPPLLRWNVNDFKNLHQRIRAVFERKNARQRIAQTV